ncbi:AAA family ATPase [Hyphomonas sp. FCG-A18]|uniref:AAA family ATPase n=1 Tax=Hyphomonas sp. FCG-A18 TaxID=3080019 RepID=UPI002B2F2C5B|nr:AAA family ATPase [Hyphomonas sp. FCG-A18]
MSHVFIAHGPKDTDALLTIHEALRAVSIPDSYVPIGETGDPDTINVSIDDAFGMVVIVSASSMRSKSVQAQLQRAMDRGLKLFPIRADNARLSRVFKSALADNLDSALADEGALDALVSAVRERYQKRCPVIAVMNLKGGVGKTTVSSQVFATWQAELGGRVLLIDLDPQYNLTQTFYDMDFADASSARDRSVISLFERSRLHSRDAVSPADNWGEVSTAPFTPSPREQITHNLLSGDGPGGRLDLISGQFEISKYAFAPSPQALTLIGANFRKMIDFYRSQYDLIVFDTNPNATFLTRCALEAADRVLAPMHPDVYSLRGVRLLNQVMQEQVTAEKRPYLSVLFNTVGRSEQSNFEADARNGVFDEQAGFALSEALLSSALPRSGHLNVKSPDVGEDPWKQLVIHKGRGGGLKSIRQTLKSIALELKTLVDA